MIQLSGAGKRFGHKLLFEKGTFPGTRNGQRAGV